MNTDETVLSDQQTLGRSSVLGPQQMAALSAADSG